MPTKLDFLNFSAKPPPAGGQLADKSTDKTQKDVQTSAPKLRFRQFSGEVGRAYVRLDAQTLTAFNRLLRRYRPYDQSKVLRAVIEDAASRYCPEIES